MTMKENDGSEDYRNNSAKMRTTLAAIRTLEAIRRIKLAELRTGISVLAINLSIITVLISTCAFWNPANILSLLVIVAVLLVVLSIIGVFFFYRGLKGMRDIDQRPDQLTFDVDSLDKMYNDILNDD